MNLIIITGSILILCGCLLYFFAFGISHLIDYSPDSDGINFILFKSLRICVLRYENIEVCETCRLTDFSWFDGKPSTVFRTLTIGGWPRLTRVMLKMKRGLFTYIFLFPRDPSQFARIVQEHMANTEEH